MGTRTAARKSSRGEETDVETVASGSDGLVDLILKQGIAWNGNGQDKELSKAQLNLIHKLYDRVAIHLETLPER